jgi:uncharacterized membrane protein
LNVPLSHWVVLLSMATVYAAIATYLSQVRFNDLYDAAWDLGVVQQSLWTGAHGSLLYETPDRMKVGVSSFLMVHTTYVALLIAPLYAAFPSPTTLLALQASALASAVLPLYLLLRREVPNVLVVFLILALFLANCAALAALITPYHWESFLPAEFLWTFWLWTERRYYLATIPAVLGMLTLEVFPILLMALVVYGLYPGLRRFLESPRETLRSLPEFWPRLRPWVALAVLAVGGYLALRIVQYDVLAPWLGTTTGGVSGQLSGGVSTFTVVSATGLTVGPSLFFWFLLLATLGFLPLFAPRSLILTVPWFLETVVLAPQFSMTFGTQYPLVAVTTLSVSLVYGAAAVYRRPADEGGAVLTLAAFVLLGAVYSMLALGFSGELLATSFPTVFWLVLAVPPLATVAIFAAAMRPSHEAPRGTPEARARRRALVRRWRTPLWGVMVALLVSFNVLLSPVLPANEGTAGPAYRFQFGTDPALAPAEWLASLVPDRAVVYATQNLFPFVANDPNAWPSATSPYPASPGIVYQPFSSSHLPTYVFTDALSWGTFPPFVQSAVLNSSTYGLVGYAVYEGLWPGSVYLFELGFRGAPQVRWASAPWAPFFATAHNLTVGPSAIVNTSGDGKYGAVIESEPAGQVTGNESELWSMNWTELPLGLYELTYNLSGSSGKSLSNPDALVAHLDVGPYTDAPAYLSANITAGELFRPGWSEYSFTIPLVLPYPIVGLRGYLGYTGDEPNGTIVLNYIELAPFGWGSTPG